MANIYDNRNPQSPEGFNPNSDNRPVAAQCSGLGKFIWYLSFLLIIPIFIHVANRNNLRRAQNEINAASSNIDVQLTKRSETITKMYDSVKGYMKHEKSTLEEIAKMRSNADSLMNQNSIEAKQELEQLNNSVFGRLMAVYENYPDLKANSLFQDLMDESAYIEREIAASRRLYNSNVNRFNQDLFVFPCSVAACELRLVTAPLYQASAKQKEDVKLEF